MTGSNRRESGNPHDDFPVTIIKEYQTCSGSHSTELLETMFASGIYLKPSVSVCYNALYPG